MECELCGDVTESSSDGVPVCPSCLSGFQGDRWGSDLKLILAAQRLAGLLRGTESATGLPEAKLPAA